MFSNASAKGPPDMYPLTDVIMMVADGKAPNKCQAINNHHADLIVTII